MGSRRQESSTSSSTAAGSVSRRLLSVQPPLASNHPPPAAPGNSRRRKRNGGSGEGYSAGRLHHAPGPRARHLPTVDVPAAASGSAKLVKLRVEGLAVGADAGITDKAFFRISFGHILRQS